MSSSRFLKSNHTRGDFAFRDVFRRNAFSTFKDEEVSENGSLYIDPSENAINCTSQITTYENGVASFHLFTRSGGEYDKSNTSSATVSINPASTVFRSSNTLVNGGFVVNAGLLTAKPSTTRVGINQPSPGYTLDVNGDCNISGNVLVNGNALSFTTSTATFLSSAAFLYEGPGENLGNPFPFGPLADSQGDAIVTVSNNNRDFTFAKQGLYLIQVQVEGSYPYMPAGEILTYFLKNGSQTLGLDSTPNDGLSAFASTRTFVVSAEIGDTVRFIVESIGANTFSAGFLKASIAFFEYGGMFSSSSGSSSNVLTGNAVVTSLNVAGDLAVQGNLFLGNDQLLPPSNTAFTTYASPSPFEYTGPGEAYANGVAFFTQTQTAGTIFVEPSGANNSKFTFTQSGLFMVQANLEGGYPWPLEGDLYTYFVQNNNLSSKLGFEVHPSTIGSFGCTKSIVLSANASDNLHFIVENSMSNDYVAGIEKASISFVNITNFLGFQTLPTSLNSLDISQKLTTGWIESPSGNLRLEAANGSSVFSSSIYDSTTAAGASVSITGTPGLLQRTTSSIRYKTSVESISDNYSEKIYDLRPVWYRSLCQSDRKDWGWYGLIAEEVAQIDPRLCFWGPDGVVEGVMYDRIVPLLLKEQGKLVARISILETQNAELKSKVDEILDLLRQS